MEIVLSKNCLNTALTHTFGIADRKSSMQILSNVLISTVGPKQVQFATTDLNISVNGIFPAQVKDEGSITILAKTLHDIVRSMPEGEITIQTENETVTVTGGRSKFKLLGLSSEDFPKLPEIEEVNFFEVDSLLVCKMIDRTSFSISSDETRPHINGGLFQGDGKILRMVTTDGHRLSKVEYKTDSGGFYNFHMVIPNKGIIEIKKLLEEGEGPAFIGSMEGSLFLKKEVEVEKAVDGEPPQMADFVLVSKLIDAEFPPYDQVIPNSFEKDIVVLRQPIFEALKRVSVVSSERTLGVKFVFSEGALEILTDNPSVGEGSELVDINYSSEEMAIGFNARYFIEVLSVLNEEEIHLELSGPLDPVVVKSSDGSFIGVIMPMRI